MGKACGIALEATLAETLPRNQIIAVDDASSGGSAEIAESFGSAVAVRRRPNGGRGAA
jgi:glycosyltransferase involved in cell wall biosynthesis